jgi:DNA-binding GntR family transcriptional regulator
MLGPADSELLHSKLDDVAYFGLRRMIIDKQLKAGTIVNQSRVSEQLGVSRTPLRRAMARLEVEGLLVPSARGLYVRGFSAEAMASMFEMRAVLEGLACRLSAGKFDRGTLVMLRAMFDDAYLAYDRDHQTRPYYEADIRFHRTVIEASGDGMLIRTCEVQQVLQTSTQRGLYRDPHETYPEHKRIIDCLESGDGDEAERLMRDHDRLAIPNIHAGQIPVPSDE